MDGCVSYAINHALHGTAGEFFQRPVYTAVHGLPEGSPTNFGVPNLIHIWKSQLDDKASIDGASSTPHRHMHIYLEIYLAMTRSQSYGIQIQRQLCENLRRHKCMCSLVRFGNKNNFYYFEIRSSLCTTTLVLWL
jgi:hypothetical protein